MAVVLRIIFMAWAGSKAWSMQLTVDQPASRPSEVQILPRPPFDSPAWAGSLMVFDQSASRMVP